LLWTFNLSAGTAELAHLATREDPHAREANRQLWKSRAKLQKEFRKDRRV
jgi:hypothetical protein